MSFYLHTGNAFSSVEAPYNTISHFITSLPKVLDFVGDWEVALVDVIFQKPDIQQKIDEKVDKTASEKVDENATEKPSEIQTIDEKVDKTASEKVDENATEKPSEIISETSDDKQIIQEKEQKTSVVYICGDFVEHSIVGDKTLPFFRSLSLSSKESQIVETYDNPFYIKLNTKFIQNLSIWLITEKGQIIKSSGQEHIFLTFHFRKRKWK